MLRISGWEGAKGLKRGEDTSEGHFQRDDYMTHWIKNVGEKDHLKCLVS